MASLEPPFTIISQGGGGSSSQNQQFHPPAATWFDEEVRQFVALEARKSLSLPTRKESRENLRGSFISGVGSIDSSVLLGSSANRVDDGGDKKDENPFEIVRYQAFGLPKKQNDSSLQTNENNEEEDMEKEPESAFDAAKKAAQNNLRSLTTEISVSFPLPLQLATVESTRIDPSVVTENTSDEDTCMTGQTQQTVALSRRIPILAKFSPKMYNGMRFIALQYTPTMIRIAIVERGEKEESTTKSPAGRMRRKTITAGERSSSTVGDDVDVHFTLDLSYDAYPVASKPESLPNFRQGSARNLFGPRVEEGIIPGTTTIIGGGVLWCARGSGDEKNTALDLIVVTTTSVLVYNMNMTKKKLVKTQVFPHDLAASFWYEPHTSTLVIGSYKSNLHRQHSEVDGLDVSIAIDRTFSIDEQDERRPVGESPGSSFPSAVMSMKTIFFSKHSPVVETLPTFAVGALREVTTGDLEEQHELQLSVETFDSAKKQKQMEDPESAVVLPTEIFIVCLYGEVFCVELGSLGSAQGGIGLTKLDREGGCIHVRHQKFEAVKGQSFENIEAAISVGVMDDLLCIFSKKQQTTYFLDVAALFSDDSRVFREIVEIFEPIVDTSVPHIHGESLSFLAPSYFLDTNGQGLLYEVSLSLPRLMEAVPPTACIIPFLLRRNGSKATIRGQIMERFSNLIEMKDMASLRTWFAVIVDQYSECDTAISFDFERVIEMETTATNGHNLTSVSLITKCSLLPQNCIGDSHGMVLPPEGGSDQVLTQLEVLQMILLPHCKLAIDKGDSKKLKFISSLSIHYLVELERRFLTPCAALQCLVIALLWRTGQASELVAFLSSQQAQWTLTRRRRQLGLPTENSHCSHVFEDPAGVDFAETLFQIATTDCVDKASTPCGPSTARQLISHGTIILLGCGATSKAVQCLLSVGELNDAINISSKKIKPNKDDKIAEGARSRDFFRAAVSKARKSPSISERCKSFYQLYYFLQQYDPSAFTSDSRKMKVSRRGGRPNSSFLAHSDDMDTMVIEQSILAHECPRFPDELFGGKESACSQKLRGMFGYYA